VSRVRVSVRALVLREAARILEALVAALVVAPRLANSCLNLSSVYSLYSVSQMSRYREVAPMQVHGHTV